MNCPSTGSLGDDNEVDVTSVGDDVWTIALNRPAKHNALRVSMLERIVDVLVQLSQSGARAVVITGRGRSFSAGGDVRALQAMDSEEELRHYLGTYAAVGEAIAGAPFPVIAALHGAVYGGGLELACMCDFRFVETSAKLCAADLAIGLVPTGGLTWRLPRLVGPGFSSWYLMTNAVLTGQSAVAVRMCDVLSEDGEAAHEAIAAARVIAGFPAAAVTATKEALRLAEHASVHETAQFEVEANLRRVTDPEVVALLNQAFPR